MTKKFHLTTLDAKERIVPGYHIYGKSCTEPGQANTVQSIINQFTRGSLTQDAWHDGVTDSIVPDIGDQDLTDEEPYRTKGFDYDSIKEDEKTDGVSKSDKTAKDSDAKDGNAPDSNGTVNGSDTKS